MTFGDAPTYRAALQVVALPKLVVARRRSALRDDRNDGCAPDNIFRGAVPIIDE